MTKHPPLSFNRFWAIVIKEFIQMRRDRLTFGMIIGIPVVQLMLFGYAINGDPKHLPTAVLLADNSEQGRSLLSALKNSDYFRFVREIHTEVEAEAALARGEVQFVVTIPENFSRTLLRGARALRGLFGPAAHAIAAPHDWSRGIEGGPRKVVREDQCIVGLGPQA